MWVRVKGFLQFGAARPTPRSKPIQTFQNMKTREKQRKLWKNKERQLKCHLLPKLGDIFMVPVLNWNCFFCCIKCINVDMSVWNASAAQAPVLEHDANGVTWLPTPWLLLLTSVRRAGDSSREHLYHLRSQQSSDVGPRRSSWLVLSQTRSHSRLSSQPDYGKRSSAVRLCRGLIVLTTSQTLEKCFFLYSNYRIIHFLNDVLVKVDIFGILVPPSDHHLIFWTLFLLSRKSTEIFIKKKREKLVK